MFKTICLQTSRLWGFHQIKPPLSPTILTKGAQGINLLKKWPEYILLWWEHQFFRYRCKCAYLVTFQTGLLHWSRSRPGAMNCHTASLGPGGAHVKRVVEMQHLKSSYFYCINVCPGCIASFVSLSADLLSWLGEQASSIDISLCQKQKKFEFCFVRFVALEGWYKDPRKRFSNL